MDSVHKAGCSSPFCQCVRLFKLRATNSTLREAVVPFFGNAADVHRGLGTSPADPGRARGLTCCARWKVRRGYLAPTEFQPRSECSEPREKEASGSLRGDVSAHVAVLLQLQGRNSARREVLFTTAMFFLRARPGSLLQYNSFLSL